MSTSRIDPLAYLGEQVEQFRQGGAGAVFAVRQINFWLGCGERFEPLHKLGLAGVAAEAVQGVDLGFHGQAPLVDRHQFLAVDKPSSERAVALIADDQHMGVRFREIVPQVVEDPAGVAHP